MRSGRLVGVVVAGLLVVGVAFSSSSQASVVGGGAAYLDPLLRQTLETAGPGDRLEAVAMLPAVPSATTLATLRTTGLSVGGFSHLPMAALQGTKAQLLAASQLTFVQSLWLNVPVEESLDQSTAILQAPEVWNGQAGGGGLGFTGRGVGVATIDSGIDGTHPGVHFPEATIQNVRPTGFKDAVWGPSVEGVPVTDVGSGHGTHVAGIIAGRGTVDGHYKGVAPGASLVGLGASDGAEMLTILQSYDWIFANKDRYGIRVINNSWAHSNPQVPYVTGNPLDEASRRAVHEHGLVVVFAAGNEGQASGNVFNRYARNDWVVSVGAVNKKGSIASMSSRGDDTWHANVMAPGEWIASAKATVGATGSTAQTPFDLTEPTAPRMVPVDQWPYYTVKSGTSMAAPHVSGVVALMLEANPTLTPAQVRSILMSTAVPVAGCAPIDCGNGTVNALAAVRAALAAANRPPVSSLTASVLSGLAPLTTTLDASASFDPDGTVAAYRWDWDGDGATDETTAEAAVTHVFPAGVHRPRVTAVDDRGAAGASVGIEVRASHPPVASASGPAKAKSGVAVTFDASGSTDPDGSIVAYEWNFGDGSSIVTTSSPTVTHTYATSRSVSLGWTVRVVDDAGVSDATGAAIRVTP